MNTIEKIRIDKWLWAARFYKTRSLASAEISKNRVLLNEQFCKPAREIVIGDRITLKQGYSERVVIVKALSAVRGPAPIAQTLYEETPDSIHKRELEKRRVAIEPEPADAYQKGRPTKKDRRALEDWRRIF